MVQHKKKKKSKAPAFTVARADRAAYQYLALREEAYEWMVSVLPAEHRPKGNASDLPFELLSGELLCHAFNCVLPGSIKKIRVVPKEKPLLAVDNATAFLKAAKALDVRCGFEPEDLVKWVNPMAILKAVEDIANYEVCGGSKVFDKRFKQESATKGWATSKSSLKFAKAETKAAKSALEGKGPGKREQHHHHHRRHHAKLEHSSRVARHWCLAVGCGQGFGAVFDLEKHMKTHLPSQLPSGDHPGKTPFCQMFCMHPGCGRGFADVKKWEEHKATHVE